MATKKQQAARKKFKEMIEKKTKKTKKGKDKK